MTGVNNNLIYYLLKKLQSDYSQIIIKSYKWLVVSVVSHRNTMAAPSGESSVSNHPDALSSCERASWIQNGP